MEHDALVYVEYILGNKEVLSNHKIYSETLQLQNVSFDLMKSGTHCILVLPHWKKKNVKKFALHRYFIL